MKLLCVVIQPKQGLLRVDGSAFPVSIDDSDLVGDLKKAIKQEIASAVQCDARDLLLWFAAINNLWLPSTELKQGLVPTFIKTLMDQEELDATWEIRELLQEKHLPAPQSRQIHVLVQTPEPQRSQEGALSVITTTSPDIIISGHNEQDEEEASFEASSFEADVAPSSADAIASRVNLMQLYGRDKLILHDYFPDRATSTHFIQDYALNQDFGVHIDSSGSLRKMTCSGSSKSADGSETPCGWSVWLARKRASVCRSKKRKTKLSHVPTDLWYISNMNLEHVPGCSGIGNPDPNSRQIVQLRGFKAAAMQGYASVMRSLMEIDGIDAKGKPSMLYRLIKDYKQNAEERPHPSQELSL